MVTPPTLPEQHASSPPPAPQQQANLNPWSNIALQQALSQQIAPDVQVAFKQCSHELEGLALEAALELDRIWTENVKVKCEVREILTKWANATNQQSTEAMDFQYEPINSSLYANHMRELLHSQRQKWGYYLD